MFVEVITKNSYLIRKHVASYSRVEERGRISSGGKGRAGESAEKQEGGECVLRAGSHTCIMLCSLSTYCVLRSGMHRECSLLPSRLAGGPGAFKTELSPVC